MMIQQTLPVTTATTFSDKLHESIRETRDSKEFYDLIANRALKLIQQQGPEEWVNSLNTIQSDLSQSEVRLCDDFPSLLSDIDVLRDFFKELANYQMNKFLQSKIANNI